MIKGHHYDPNKNYAPRASWMSIRILITLALTHRWHTIQLDCVLAFPQAPIEKELYMRVPPGFKVALEGDPRNYVLKLHQNVYWQKQSGRV